ncbi:MAG: Gldg family protein [Clostridia bacterium]|nr:Gldg family protein [Clostridia bacterium]
MKKLLRSEKLRPVILLIALALVIALNCAVSGLGGLHVDLSARRAATPSQEALAVARGVSEPVAVYLMESESGRNVWLDEIAARLAAASKNVTVETVDPASARVESLAPLANGQELAEGSVLVASGKRSVLLTADDLFSYEYDQSAYYYYGVISYTRADFTAQDALCRAFRYVTRDDMPVLYLLNGHGESGWDGALNSLCFRNSIALEDLTLSPGQAVPEDAAAVLVCGPTSPVGEETAEALLSYLQAGGDVLLMTNYTTDFTGLDRVTEYYGMTRKTGLVLDNDASHVYGADYKYFLRPDLRASAVTDPLIEAGQSVLVPVAEAIVRSDVRRAGLNAQPILITSGQGYMKTNTEAIATLDQESQDETGTFIVGMAAVEGDTHLTWLASIAMIATTNDAASNGGNEALAAAALRQMFDFPEPAAAIPATDLITEPASIPQVPALILLVALPLICLIIGLVLRRRHSA